MSTPRFVRARPDCGVPAILRCPGCGFEYLHQQSVEVFERDEDDARGTHVTVTRAGAAADADLSGNPSERRQGLKVAFRCEGCWAVSTLALAQHKGHTFVEFLPGVPPPDEDQDAPDPVAEFVREKCVTGPGHEVRCPILFNAWAAWADLRGLDHGDPNAFARRLAAALPGVVTRQRGDGGLAFVFRGVRLGTAARA
ncbi:MAG: hypothetical protein C0501_30575 [Isosphaera sp.]|nr:hypothetical protein [Isosphaera sp.]